MSLKRTLRSLSKRCSGTVSYRGSWMSPSLSSHQQLDAGIAARQHAGRKALKKAKRPFANYFKTEYRSSPSYGLPMVGNNGVISAYNAAKMMADPSRSWGAPWGLATGRVRTRGKRQDVLERPEPEFGEDALDACIERLVELRFDWDKEDGISAPSLVPASLYRATEHCEPYAPGYQPISASAAASSLEDASQGGVEDIEEEEVVISGVRVAIRGRNGRHRPRAGHPKREYVRPKWGFTGVDTVPSVVLDASRGPLVSSSNETLLTLRWKAENRITDSVAGVVALRQRMSAVAAVGLPTRSALLLLKSVATTEMEDPAMDVALAVAMGENYYAYEPTECLELLRCLRRVALVRLLPTLPAPAPYSGSERGGRCGFPLYDDATLCHGVFASYIKDAAPLLAQKVWSRLPEHSQRLLTKGYHLDWVDLLSLAVEVAGPARLPRGLPNAASDAPYAAKYLFLRHTLELSEPAVRAVTEGLIAGAGKSDSPASSSCVHYVEEDAEVTVRPLVLWLAASMLVRLVAESLGDVLRFLEQCLRQHAELAAEEALERLERHNSSGSAISGADEVDLERYLDRLALARPHVVGPYSLRMSRPRKVRVRLLPFEAFPSVTRCLPTPFATVTRRAERAERERQQQQRRRKGRLQQRQRAVANERAIVETEGSGAVGSAHQQPHQLESPFATAVIGSPVAKQSLKRAYATLDWATMVLTYCKKMVSGLPPLFPSAPSRPTPAGASAVDDGGGSTSGIENVSAIEQRQMMCDIFVKSRVQQQLDTLFTCIPWEGMESHLQPLLDSAQEEEKESCAAADDDGNGATTHETDEALKIALSMMETPLAAPVGTGDSVGCDEAACPSPCMGRREECKVHSDATITDAEREMREMMVALQEHVARFEIAVADILVEQERFFGMAPSEEEVTQV